MYNKIFNIICGFIIGILLTFLFRSPIVFRGPDSNIVRKQIFKYNNKCYKLTPVIYICPPLK